MDAYDFFYDPHTTAEIENYQDGRREAWEAYHLMDTTVDQLEDRYEWIVDPRVSDYTAAYCAGYRVQIQDLRASEYLAELLKTS